MQSGRGGGVRRIARAGTAAVFASFLLPWLVWTSNCCLRAVSSSSESALEFGGEPPPITSPTVLTLAAAAAHLLKNKISVHQQLIAFAKAKSFVGAFLAF